MILILRGIRVCCKPLTVFLNAHPLFRLTSNMISSSSPELWHLAPHLTEHRSPSSYSYFPVVNLGFLKSCWRSHLHYPYYILKLGHWPYHSGSDLVGPVVAVTQGVFVKSIFRGPLHYKQSAQIFKKGEPGHSIYVQL
jgi:hypothetical protein